MQFSIISLITFVAAVSALDIESKASSYVVGKASSVITSNLASYTGPGASQLSSVISNPTQAESLFSKATSAVASSTPTGAANGNAVGHIGLGAAVAVGIAAMV